jgi:hypothetical protein
MSEVDLITVIGTTGFPIAVAMFLLYERTKVFSETKEDLKALNMKYDALSALLIEVVKGNTEAQTALRGTIQKLCEIIGEGTHVA